MNRVGSVLVISVLLSVARVPLVQAEGLQPVPGDDDVLLLDQHFAMHLGGSIGAASFSVGALVVGIKSLVEASDQTSTRAAQSHFVLGLTLTSMGVSTVLSASTGIQRSALHRKSTRKQFLGASPAQKRLLREREVKRLRALVSNRALSLIADGSFLAIGIVLMAVEATDLGLPLVLDGSLVLGVDIFRLVIDHQFSLRWESRGLDSEGGYFSALRTKKLLPVPLPVILPGGDRGAAPGAGVVIAGVF
jgi:hypothetical protein